MPSLEKRTGTLLDYQIDWSDALDTGDSIATSGGSTWSVPSTSGLTIENTSYDSGHSTATVWLSGGTPGLVPVISNTIRTTNGRTLERTVVLYIVP